MQELCKLLCLKRKPFLLIFFILILFSLITFAKQYTQDYNNPITFSQGDLRWCKLNAECTLMSLTVGNLSVIGQVFNVTMNLITWNITESFNVGGNLIAKNATFERVSGNGSGLTSLTHSLQDAYDDGNTIDADSDLKIFIPECRKCVGELCVTEGACSEDDPTSDSRMEFNLTPAANLTNHPRSEVYFNLKPLIVGGHLEYANMYVDIYQPVDALSEVGAESYFRIRARNDSGDLIEVFKVGNDISEAGVPENTNPLDLRTRGWIPLEDNKFDVGSPTFRFRSGYFANVFEGISAFGDEPSLVMNASSGDVFLSNQNFNVTNNGSVVTSKGITAKNLTLGSVKLITKSPNNLWNDSLTIITGVAKDGSNISFVVIDDETNLPNFILKRVAPEKGSVIVGSLILSSSDQNLNTSNATLCKAHADEDNIELKIDCNSSSSTFAGTGADLYIEGDLQVNQELWLRGTDGEFHFFTRELDLIDELFNNILFNKIDASISGTTLTIISQHIVDTLVVNLEENTTIFTSNSSTVTFTEGTNSSPVENFITYQDTDNPTLTRDASDPSDEHADVIRFLAGSSGRIFGAVVDNARNDEYIHDATKRWFDEGAIYVSGFGMNVTASSFNITNGGNMVMIINRHSHTKNFSTDTEYFFVRENGNYNISLNLDEIDEYGDGGAIGNNKFFNVVFGIVHNDLKPPMLMAVIQNTPASAEYKKTKDAEVDTDGALTIFPSDPLLKRLFLPIGRVVMKRSSSVNTIQSLSNGEFFIDLRGTVTATGSSPPSTGIINHPNLNLLAWSVADHTVDTTMEFGNNKLNEANITNSSISAEDVDRDLPTTCPSDTFVTGWGDNLSTTTCSADSDNGTIWNKTGNNIYPSDLNDNVGIGTDSPTTELEVVGTITVENISSPYANKSYIFFQPDGSIGITLDPVEIPQESSPPKEKETITRTASTETVCSNGKCHLVLYSGTRFVNEDNKWKDVKDARSLKGIFKIKYIKNDGIHDFEIVDLNYTSVELRVFVKDFKELNKDIPFKVDNVEKETKKLTSVGEKSTVTFTSNNILASNYTFGSKSTIIILQDANSENLDDTVALKDTPTTNYGSAISINVGNSSTAFLTTVSFIRFNISVIPSDVVIDEALLNLFHIGDSGDNHAEIEIWTIPSQTWLEGSVTWNNQPAKGTQIASPITPSCAVGQNICRINWTVTSWVSSEYGDNRNNVSFGIFDLSEEAEERCNLASKEYTADITRRPYLNITYSTRPSVSSNLVSPADASTDTDGEVVFNCSATTTGDDVVLKNITLYHNITGTWKANKTQDVGGTSAYANFTTSITNGTNLVWNCLASNDATNTSFAGANFTLDITLDDVKNPKLFVQNMSGDEQWYVTSFGDMWLRNDFSMGGDLTVDTNTLFVDSLNDKVGIGTTNPTQKLSVTAGNILVDNDYSFAAKLADETEVLLFKINTGDDMVIGGGAMDDMKFDVGGVAGAITIKETTGYIGLGTATPSVRLHIVDNAAESIESLRIDNLNGAAGFGSSIKWFGASQLQSTGIIEVVRNGGGLDFFMKFSTTNDITANNASVQMVIDGDGKVGIGTETPSYPLEVAENISGISIWAQGNISANDYITRTSIFDKSKGTALSLIKDSEDLLTDGEIDHKKFYGYATYQSTDHSRPETEEYPCIDKKGICERTVYPYTKIEEGVSLNKEIDLLRQSIYELKTELCIYNNYSWC